MTIHLNELGVIIATLCILGLIWFGMLLGAAMTRRLAKRPVLLDLADSAPTVVGPEEHLSFRSAA